MKKFSLFILIIFTFSFFHTVFSQVSWQAIGEGLGSTASAFAFHEFNDQVYVGGYLFSVNNNSGQDDVFLSTDGESWGIPAPSSLISVYATIYDIDEYQGNLIVAGSFRRIGEYKTLSNIAMWDGEIWHSLGEGLSGEVNTVFVDGDDLYVGGSFSDAGGVDGADRIARWDGSKWNALGGGVNGSVYAILKKDDIFYVGGRFTEVKNTQNLRSVNFAVWNGTSWSNPMPECVLNGGVYDFIEYNDELIIGSGGSLGCSCVELTSNSVLKYKNGTCTAMGNVWPTVHDMTIHDGSLYIAGRFQDAGDDPEADYVARWNGSNWENVGLPFNDWCYSLLSTGDDLYVGGRFDDINGNPYMDGVVRLGEKVNTKPAFKITHYQIQDFEEPYDSTIELRSYMYSGESDLKSFSLCSDGSVASLFLVESLNQTSLSTWKIESENNPNPTRYDDLFGQFNIIYRDNDSLIVSYQHPDRIDAPSHWKSNLKLNIFDEINGISVNNFSLEVQRPPVVMVHGLGGNVSSFSELREYLINSGGYRSHQLKNTDYKKTNSRSFEENKCVVRKEVKSVLKFINGQKVAVKELDVVGHSMGGILSRLYIQDQDYGYDINKLISLNTPHSGSQIANLIFDDSFPGGRKLLMCNTFLEFASGVDCDEGAVSDLRVNSEAITQLNSLPNLNRNIVPYRPVVSIVSSVDDLHETVQYVTGLSENELLTLFQGEQHDAIVSLSSQLGAAFFSTPFFTGNHINTKSDDSILENIKFLLFVGTPNSQFSRLGFFPFKLNYETPAKYSEERFHELLPINIPFPVQGMAVNYGDEINIDVDGHEDIVETIIFNGSEILKKEASNYIQGFTYQITPKSLGRLDFSVWGKTDDNTGNIGLAETHVIVTTSETPKSIVSGNSFTNVEVGNTATTPFLGKFENFDLYVHEAPNVQFIFEKGLADYIGEGTIRGLKEGQDTLKIVFNGVESESMPIIIEEPINPISSTKTNTDYPKDDFTNLLKIYPSPSSSLITIETLQKDMITNGVIEIFDVNGKKYAEDKLVKMSAGHILDISDLPEGVYFAVLRTKSKLYSGRFVKQ